MHGCSLLLPSAYNLDRARQERAKAETCTCEASRRGHLELAAIFEARASALERMLLID
jgi:hypothetical protein